MKSLATLHQAVLLDAGRYCSVDTKRDAERLALRVEDEGESFLTIVLPNFAKTLERGLSDGVWPRLNGFKHHRGLPAFLRGFLTRIFDADGRILDDPDANSIWAVRQVCYLTHKISRPTTPAREKKAIDGFVQTDSLLETALDRVTADQWETFDKVVLEWFGDMFNELDRKIASFELVPRHGPGAVADRLDHPQRWQFDYWTDRLEGVFPSWRYRENLPTSVHPCPVSTDQELPVRVVTVPKTQSTPRIIAIEPSTMQYAQQGLKREIYEYVSKSHLAEVLGFADQTRNQLLARKASLTGLFATLDLSEASDRVHLDVVIRLLKRWPHLQDFVLATRSSHANVDGLIIRLNKFASMGSALTFPIEAIVFVTLALMGMQDAEGRRLTKRNTLGRISVYGDDIIVPTNTTAAVIDYLELFGFKVNRNKSFWSGYFRESCGKEYYRGHDVSVVRLRAEVPTSRRDAVLIKRFTDFRNRAYSAGLWSAVKVCEPILDRFSIPFQFVLEGRVDDLGIIARETILQTPFRGVWSPHHHKWVKKVPYLREKAKGYRLDGTAGLLNWFHEAVHRTDSFVGPSFENQERPHAFSINLRGVESFPKVSTGRLARGMALN
jgi:hypothetical protein